MCRIPMEMSSVQAFWGALKMFRMKTVSCVTAFTRPSRGDQSPLAEGVLLPTTLDDFDDSVSGDPITYARCEHFPGSSGSTFLLDPTVFQTVLASGTSSLPPAGTSAAAPPTDLGDGRLLETGLPGCPYRFSESGGLPFFR